VSAWFTTGDGMFVFLREADAPAPFTRTVVGTMGGGRLSDLEEAERLAARGKS
jgi:hypothetical protein